MEKMEFDGPESKLTGIIIECAIEVHRHFGCGLKEEAYEAALFWELQQKHLRVERQVACPVIYMKEGIQHVANSGGTSSLRVTATSKSSAFPPEGAAGVGGPRA